MIVVVEITTVDAPPTSWSFTCCAAFAAFSRSDARHRVDRCGGAVQIKAELRRDRLDLRTLERLAHGGAIGVLFRCAIRDRRRELVWA